MSFEKSFAPSLVNEHGATKLAALLYEALVCFGVCSFSNVILKIILSKSRQ
jgi:hypothetical protein